MNLDYFVTNNLLLYFQMHTALVALIGISYLIYSFTCVGALCDVK